MTITGASGRVNSAWLLERAVDLAMSYSWRVLVRSDVEAPQRRPLLLVCGEFSSLVNSMGLIDAGLHLCH